MRSKLLAAGLLLAFVSLAACGHAPTTPTPPVQQPPPASDPPPPPPPPVLGVTSVLAFGDSMTEGTVSPSLPLTALDAGKPESYPFKLQTLLTSRYTSQTITVLNAGKAGERASDGRGRLWSNLRDTSPQVLLLMDGANDLLAGASVGATVNAMEDMVRDARGRGVQVLVLNLPPERASGRRGGAAAAVPLYNSTLAEMAAKKGARIVDVYGQFDVALIGEDGLHPTEAGYARLAEIVAAALAAAFEVHD